ncbi:DUF2806 domain-containing protein [Oceanicoccus sp. KOV_DT_Chl]|uniref:DUF2806 domain-containing protein n=1 Tax=Oceanicoccus sp. KOV_DT_Chl TaxID=1904639 RepID=UPI00135BA6C6|nr:DUF2806 domain-containing protein [Oceanicoccus sp. KOV_DT_Chl]
MTEVDRVNDFRDDSIKEQWLDKLWQHLFDGDAGGLMSPGQIRREHRNRERVRQLEMASILEVEQELNGIHRGQKSLDEHGNLIDTPNIETIATHQIIENTAVDQSLDIGTDGPAAMLRSVVKEVSVRDLERSLNLRKIAILAESEILGSVVRPISNQPVNAEWMIRWRESAETVFNPELQLFWARVLTSEVASPGSYSLSLQALLLQISAEDLGVIRVGSQYAFDDFIYDATGGYFNTGVHQGFLDVMEDLGLLNADSSSRNIGSNSPNAFSVVLCCHSKGLRIDHADRNKQLVLPVFKLSRVGRQLLQLCDADADVAYLFDLAKRIQQQGFKVALGDLLVKGDTRHFVEKMVL